MKWGATWYDARHMRGESVSPSASPRPCYPAIGDERSTWKNRVDISEARGRSIYASIRPPQLKQAVSFYEEKAIRMLSD